MVADDPGRCPTCGAPHPTSGMGVAITNRDVTRVPAGVPDGGRFASRVSPETPIRLHDVSHGGTFEFPPAFSTADELVAFWSRVPVPDRATRAFQLAYQSSRQAEIDERMSEWDAANPAPHDTRLRKADPAAWQAARQAHLDEVAASFPTGFIRADRVRPILRIAQMCRWSATLSQDEMARFDALMFDLPDGSTSTAMETSRAYRFKRFAHLADHVDDRAVGDGNRELLVNIQRSLNRIAQVGRETTGSIEALHEQVYQGQRGY